MLLRRQSTAFWIIPSSQNEIRTLHNIQSALSTDLKNAQSGTLCVSPGTPGTPSVSGRGRSLCTLGGLCRDRRTLSHRALLGAGLRSPAGGQLPSSLGSGQSVILTARRSHRGKNSTPTDDRKRKAKRSQRLWVGVLYPYPRQTLIRCVSCCRPSPSLSPGPGAS